MRTTLFFTAAFAAINFALQANAVSIPTTNIERSATELAQVEANLSTFLEADAEKADYLPGNLTELQDMFNFGHSEYDSKLLVPAILAILQSNGAQRPKPSDTVITNWEPYANNFNSIVDGYRNEQRQNNGKDGADYFKNKLDHALRRLQKTLTEGGDVQGMSTFLKTRFKAREGKKD